MPARIAVVVLNWNGAEDTLACLRSIKASTVPTHSIVVDNGSSDDSAERIAASGLADTLLPTGDNLGFAEGTNVGLRHALGNGHEVVVVLNNDTLVQPSALAALADRLPPDYFRAISPLIRLFDRPDESWFAGGSLGRGWPQHVLSPAVPNDESSLVPSELLSGCCIAARRDTWERVGLFDASFFLIFEDSDWSMRARQHGADLYVAPDAEIVHKVSRSFAGGPASLLGSFYFARNGLRFEFRYVRRATLRFAAHWIVKPTLRTGKPRDPWAVLLFRWLGVLAFVCRQHGRAPAAVERLAGRLVDVPTHVVNG